MGTKRERTEGKLLVVGGGAFILWGLVIGGAGVASAGCGIGIPMIPVGLVLLAYGIYKVVTSKSDAGPRETK